MKVIDLSVDVAGQWAAKLLAMAGGEVTRCAEAVGPQALSDYLGAFKRVEAWTGPEMLGDADLVFVSFDRGDLVGLARGLEMPAGCVQVVTSTYGMDGPYAAYRGGPMAGWAAGGYLAITGKPEREPLIGPDYLCEYVAGYTAAIAAEAALHERARGGRAATIDISTMEAMLAVHQTTFSTLPLGQVRRRTGRISEVYPLTALPCRDGYVKLCCVTEEECDRFLTAIGRGDLLADQRFADRDRRFANREQFDAEIARFLMEHDAEGIVDILEVSGVAAAKVATAADVKANPQLAYRGFWGQGPGPGNPVPPSRRFAAAPALPRPRALEKARSPHLPLAGVVVADFTVYWAGPSATRMLADLGARVIWVERPGSRQPWRFDEEPGAADLGDLYNLDMSRNKESVVLDLSSPEGLAAARTLIAYADVVVENNRPGVMDKLGLGPARVCADNPQIVYVSLSGYGGSGPWSGRRSYGPAIEAASSIEGRTGYPGDEPMRLGHTLPDGTGGLAGALAALRGLRERRERGTGGWFDVSQLESYVAMSGEELVGDETLSRKGNASRWPIRQGVYPCAGEDEWIAIRLGEAGDEEKLGRIAGIATADDAAIAGFSRGWGKHELAAALQAEGLEAFPVLKPDEFTDDPHLRARRFFREVPFGDRLAKFPGSPFRPLGDPTGTSPNFGADSEAILAELAACAAADAR